MKNKKIKSLFELRIWVKSKDLAVKIYRVTSLFPSSEKFIISSQIQRAAISVMANIAEGYYRESTKELIKFLVIARGSAGEVVSHVLIAFELGYLDENQKGEIIMEYEELIVSINALIKSLKNR